ncbi:MAG: hypothetical protein J0M17_16370 [Planctomycetes bacterium]|nr:hypothetical protein [Planctomycetota bacterium]
MSASGGSTASGGGSGQQVMIAQSRPFLAWLRPRARRAGILALGALRFYGNFYGFPVPPAQQQPQQPQGNPTDISKVTGAVAAAQAATDARLDEIDRYLGICTKGATPSAPPAGATPTPPGATPPVSGAGGSAAVAPAAPAAPAVPVVKRTLVADIQDAVKAAVSASVQPAVDAAVKTALNNAFDDAAIQNKIRKIAATPAALGNQPISGPTNISAPAPAPSATGAGSGS